MFLFVPECISLFSSLWSDPMWNVILSARQLEFSMVGNMQASLKLALTGWVCGLRFWCNVKRLEYTVRSFLTYSLHFWSSEMPLDKIFYKITVPFIFGVEFNLTQKLRKMIFPSGFKNSKLDGKWRRVFKNQ